MIRISRWPMVTIAYLFGLFHATLGVIWSDVYHDRRLGFLSVAIFVGALSSTILFYRHLEIPVVQALANLAVAAVLPNLVESQIGAENYGTYATWHVGALGVLLGATALRGQAYYAWGGAVVVWVETIRAEGFGQIASSGLVGLLILVLIGHATNLGLKRSERDIAKYIEAAEVSTMFVTNREVTQQTQRETFDRSAPVIRRLLKTAIRNRGKLGDEDRREALRLETELSDELIGKNLADPVIQRAAREARSRGVEIALIDEGGLDELTREELKRLLLQVAEIINDQVGGRIVVRSSAKTSWRISVSAYARGSKVPNGDWKL